MLATATLPAFPVPEVDGLEVAWGAHGSRYLRPEQIPADFWNGRHSMCDVASKLFFRGGKLADHNLRFKPGINERDAMAALHALFRSFEPKHEQKIGTIGIALANWCEPIEGGR